jgi:transcription factor E2F7/8
VRKFVHKKHFKTNILLLLFLCFQPSAKINLEFAAKVIHGPVLPDAVMKTRIRRLYDIANILQSLKLIQKVQVRNDFPLT